MFQKDLILNGSRGRETAVGKGTRDNDCGRPQLVDGHGATAARLRWHRATLCPA